ncbi:fumarate respiration sensor kinase protein DcuS [Klebsiella michiganensis]|uniref:Fumarate respiration sensor kinase protein DcuS n=1 Tax=Klebsiella michiganensis TaxID=1134687 RepID=A0A7H4PM16_9ENTR|nr:fumarate respiration sensor kinase protein DcuS [Klebsiella michiganensis]
MPDCPNEKQVTVLVTVLGNLIENALDAMSGQAKAKSACCCITRTAG